MDGCWKCDEMKMRVELSNPPSYFKYFSTKEKCKEYILLNKPCLSVSDVTDFLHLQFVFNSIDFNHLKDFAKTKL